MHSTSLWKPPLDPKTKVHKITITDTLSLGSYVQLLSNIPLKSINWAHFCLVLLRWGKGSNDSFHQQFSNRGQFYEYAPIFWHWNILLIFTTKSFLIHCLYSFVMWNSFWFCCFVQYVILTLLFMFIIWCVSVAFNKHCIHTYCWFATLNDIWWIEFGAFLLDI